MLDRPFLELGHVSMFMDIFYFLRKINPNSMSPL
jgi:hypothetical protein